MADLDPDDITNTEMSGLLPPITARQPVDREGLPAGYRMRADSHYVDQLSARSADVPMRFVSIDEIDAPEIESAADGSLRDLIASVAEHGVLQPLLVRRDGARYRLIAGRRRFAAARAVSLARVPCLVHTVDRDQADALARAAAVNGRVIHAAERSERSPHDSVPVAALAETIADIQSATTLVTSDASPMVRRVALELLRAAAWRAGWQAAAASILDGSHRWTFRPQLVGPVLTSTCEGVAAFARLHRIETTLRVPDWNIAAALDRDAVAAAVSGAIVALADGADADEPRRLTVDADRDATGRIVIHVSLDPAARHDVAGSSPFGLSVARTVAERHGGSVDVRRDGTVDAIRLTIR